jgi:hypothetical protein
MPVSADGNCADIMDTSTLPTAANTTLARTPNLKPARLLTFPESMVTSPAPLSLPYLDLYSLTTLGSPYCVSDKSVVIHSSNATRLTYANFTHLASGTSTGSSVPSRTASATPSAYRGTAERATVSITFGFVADALRALFL